MTIQLSTGNIHYIDEGPKDGLPIVFLHGFPFNHTMWDAQVKAISGKYRAISYDIRGHGMSDIGEGQYTIEGHVDDLFELLKALEIAKPVIVGLSMGGYIALRAIEREPDRFRGAVLCDTRSEADGNEAKIRRAATVRSVKRIGSEAFAREFVKAIFAPESFSTRTEAVDFIRTIISRTPPLSIAGTQLALAARTDTSDGLGSIAFPTLILVGEHDKTTPPEASEAMHRRITGSTMHIVPNAAHMSNLENPVFFNSRLVEFLDGLSV
jgi:pimeloyl-ACP methyl ester carboxylesterase